MADAPAVRTQPLDRDQLRKLTGGDFRAIKFLENLGVDVGETLPQATQSAATAAETAQGTADTAVSDAAAAQGTADGAQSDASDALTQIGNLRASQYVVLTATTELSNERVLTQGTNITITDGGAGAALTVEVQENPAFTDSLDNVVIEISDNGAASQLAFFGATPIARPTTAFAGATFSAGTGTPLLSASTFDGYTVAQVVAALRALGILA